MNQKDVEKLIQHLRDMLPDNPPSDVLESVASLTSALVWDDADSMKQYYILKERLSN